MTDRVVSVGDPDLLAVSEERFRWMTGVVSDPMLIIGELYSLLHYNRAAALLFGHDMLAAGVGANDASRLGELLLASAGTRLEVPVEGGGTAIVIPHALDTVWDQSPATAVLLEPVDEASDAAATMTEAGASPTTALVVEVTDIEQPRRTIPVVNDLFGLLEPLEGVTQAGGAAWCVVWHGRLADESMSRAEQIVDQLVARVGERGDVRAGIARQRRGEDTPSLLRRSHRGLQHSRTTGSRLSSDPGEAADAPDSSMLYEHVIGESVACELSPVADVSSHRPVGALAQPMIDGHIISDARRLLGYADAGTGQTFDRLAAADALVKFSRIERRGRSDALHIPVYRHSITAADAYLRWLLGAAAGVGVGPGAMVLGIHEGDVVADPAAIRFLAKARMAGFRTAVRALSGARLPLATLVDLWPDALLLASSVVRGDESRLLPALLAAGDEIGAVAIATGVTTTSQLDLLLDYECRYAVGPLLAEKAGPDFNV